jgi:hypothetical protein
MVAHALEKIFMWSLQQQIVVLRIKGRCAAIWQNDALIDFRVLQPHVVIFHTLFCPCLRCFMLCASHVRFQTEDGLSR